MKMSDYIVDEIIDFIKEENKYINKLEKMIKDYKSRCEKAIEILKLCNSKCAKETISILQGVF